MDIIQIFCCRISDCGVRLRQLFPHGWPEEEICGSEQICLYIRDDSNGGS